MNAGEVPSLDGPLAKMDRAWLHLRDLNHEVGTFKRAKAYDLVLDFDPETEETIARIKMLRTPRNPQWGLLIGDVVHNLRSALDHLVWQLVLLNDAKPIRDNQFPIYSVEKDYWERPKDRSESNRDRTLKGVRIEHRTPIDEAQPYNGGVGSPDPARNFLALLSWLSNSDKHKVVHTAFLANRPLSSASFHITGTPGDTHMVVKSRSGPMEDGAEFVRFKPATPQTHMHVHGSIRLAIGIGDGRLDIAGLNQIADYVDRFIWSFKPVFEGKPFRGIRKSRRARPVGDRVV
jgi:hypothetical protein